MSGCYYEIDRRPPRGYQPTVSASGQVSYYLEPQEEYAGVVPLFMVMLSDEQEDVRILAERCLAADAVTIVDALRLQSSIANHRGAP